MSNSVYPINKGINKSIEFKGLKAQYIWYFGGIVIGLFILFAILYIMGVNAFLCIGIVSILGTVLTIKIYAISNKYGQHGMMKKVARRSVPKVVRLTSRSVFYLEKK